MAVIIDIIDGSEADVTANGWKLTRRATVTGVEGEGHAKLINACYAAGMPSIGDEHPTIAAAKLKRIVPRGVTTDTVKVDLVYEQNEVEGPAGYGDSVVEYSASLQQIQTVACYSRSTYTPPSGMQQAKVVYDTTKEQLVSPGLPKLVPIATLLVRRKESTNPGSKARRFVGTVNDGAWSLDSSCAAHTWMCAGIDASTSDQGETYDVTYRFMYRPETWKVTDFYIAPEAHAKKESDPICEFTIYKEEDFDDLNL